MEYFYNPPFSISADMLNLVAEISEMVGALSDVSAPIHLRKDNKIRSIHSSLAIENNTLSLEQVSAIIDGKKVLGLKREIDEVKNAYACYGLISQLSPHKISDLLKAHAAMMSGLVENSGNFRTGGVAVFKGDEVVHMAPPASEVHALMERLMGWLKMSEVHPLIKSCVFHYEFEFIHPLADGKGRIGRFWQSMISTKWKKIFSYLPIETVIYENQQEYYDVLNIANRNGHSTEFVEFMLKALKKALQQFAAPAPHSENEYIDKLIKAMGNREMSAMEIMAKLGLKNRANFRKNYLVPALDGNFIVPTSNIKNNPRQKYRLANR